MAVYGDTPFTAPRDPEDGDPLYFFLMPFAMPYLGAVFGTLVFAMGISLHKPHKAKVNTSASVKIKEAVKRLGLLNDRLKAKRRISDLNL